MPILKASGRVASAPPESTPEPLPVQSLLVQFAPRTVRIESQAPEESSGNNTPTRHVSLDEVDLNVSKDGNDRAFVEDHVKNAIIKGGLGSSLSVGSKGSLIGFNSEAVDVYKYISIALLLITMVVGMIVLFIDVDGLDAFYELLESSPTTSYVIFIAMFGVPVILVTLITRNLCQKRIKPGKTRSGYPTYDKPYSVEPFDPDKSPISGLMELDAEMLRKDSMRSLEGMPFEGEDDESAVADHYL